MEDDPLALETRRRLYQFVRTNPGVGAREAQRGASTGWGETVYHLDRLTESGLLHREKGGHQDHYFVAEVPLGDRRLLGLARSPAARRILVVLLESPDRTVPTLVERTGLSQGRISIHLRRFLAAGLVRTGRDGRFRTFAVIDEGRVVRLLVAYRDGFADPWIERLEATWSEVFRP
jgi:predicted transcriptional regulator